MATFDTLTEATYISPSSVSCALPTLADYTRTKHQTKFVAMEYSVSVSNGGFQFGPALDYIVYSGACVMCDDLQPVSPAVCSIKVNHNALRCNCIEAHIEARTADPLYAPLYIVHLVNKHVIK